MRLRDIHEAKYFIKASDDVVIFKVFQDGRRYDEIAVSTAYKVDRRGLRRTRRHDTVEKEVTREQGIKAITQFFNYIESGDYSETKEFNEELKEFKTLVGKRVGAYVLLKRDNENLTGDENLMSLIFTPK